MICLQSSWNKYWILFGAIYLGSNFFGVNICSNYHVNWKCEKAVAYDFTIAQYFVPKLVLSWKGKLYILVSYFSWWIKVSLKCWLYRYLLDEIIWNFHLTRRSRKWQTESGVGQRLFPSCTGFVRGIHRWLVNSPHKGPVTRKLFTFDDVIMKSSNCTHVHQALPLVQYYNFHVNDACLCATCEIHDRII